MLIAHTNGVTFRDFELLKVASNLRIRIVNDFSSNHQSKKPQNHRKTRKITLKKLLRKIALFSGFLSESNTTIEYIKIQPWVLTIRGHYSGREISYSNICAMQERSFLGTITLFPRKIEITKTLGVHYRLGDLLGLMEKSYIPSYRIIDCINSQIIESSNINCYVLSDSPDKALELLMPLNRKFQLIDASRGSLETIHYLMACNHFLGTNSKIGLWVTILRVHILNNSENYLPIELADSLNNIFPKKLVKLIKYY